MGIKLDCTITQEQADKMLMCTHQAITFHGHIIKNLDFSSKDVSNVFFAGIWMEETSFREADCLGTSFYGTFLENVDFTGANLHKAIFKDAKISGCCFKGVKAPLWKKIYLWLKNS